MTFNVKNVFLSIQTLIKGRSIDQGKTSNMPGVDKNNRCNYGLMK